MKIYVEEFVKRANKYSKVENVLEHKMKLKFLKTDTIMLHLIFFISCDQKQKSGNKGFENCDLIRFLIYS